LTSFAMKKLTRPKKEEGPGKPDLKSPVMPKDEGLIWRGRFVMSLADVEPQTIEHESRRDGYARALTTRLRSIIQ